MSGRDMAARMPDGRLDVIADAGHLPWIDQPEAVAAALVAFLGARHDPLPHATTRG